MLLNPVRQEQQQKTAKVEKFQFRIEDTENPTMPLRFGLISETVILPSTQRNTRKKNNRKKLQVGTQNTFELCYYMEGSIMSRAQNEAKFFYLCSVGKITLSLRQRDPWGHGCWWAGKIGPIMVLK